MQLQLVLDDVLVCRLVVVFVVFDVVVVIVVVAVAAPVIFNAHFPCLTAFIVCQLKIYLITLLHTVFILFGFSFSFFFGIRFCYQSRCFNGCQSWLSVGG